MFGIVDVIMFCFISSLVTDFVCLFMMGASTLRREEEAYKNGYDKGYSDGKKVGESK